MVYGFGSSMFDFDFFLGRRVGGGVTRIRQKDFMKNDIYYQHGV